MAKREVIDVAARAEFEAYRASGVPELRDLEWETLPDTDGDRTPGPRCKMFWRREVSTAVEALWVRGLIVGS